MTIKTISFILTLCLLLTSSISAFATQQDNIHSNKVTIAEDGIYIDDTFYSQEQFVTLLYQAKEIELPSANTRSFALTAGSFFIPGLGPIVITATGIILFQDEIVEAGCWVYDTIVEWFTTMQFNKSAKKAVDNCNSNKQHHIMNSKHNWNKFNRDPKWSDIAPILIKVLKDGSQTYEKNGVYIRTLVYKGETVVVRFIKDAKGLVENIGTAWTK